MLRLVRRGETISEQTKCDGQSKGMKMDSRCLGYCVKSKKYGMDLACLELSRFPCLSKVRHDRAKVLIAGKTHLDTLLSQALRSKEEDTALVLEMQVASLEFAIFSVSLEFKGLYVGQLMGSSSLPTGGVHLDQFKDTCVLLFHYMVRPTFGERGPLLTDVVFPNRMLQPRTLP